MGIFAGRAALVAFMNGFWLLIFVLLMRMKGDPQVPRHPDENRYRWRAGGLGETVEDAYPVGYARVEVLLVLLGAAFGVSCCVATCSCLYVCIWARVPRLEDDADSSGADEKPGGLVRSNSIAQIR